MMMSSGVWQRLPFMVLCLCSTLWWLQGAPWWVNTCQILSQKKFAKKLLKIPWASSLLQVFGGLCKWSSIQADSRDISGGAWGGNKSHEDCSSKIIFLKVFFWYSICISAFVPLSTSRCDLCTWSFVPPPDWMEAENSAFIRISFQLFSAECFSQWSHARWSCHSLFSKPNFRASWLFSLYPHFPNQLSGPCGLFSGNGGSRLLDSHISTMPSHTKPL